MARAGFRVLAMVGATVGGCAKGPPAADPAAAGGAEPAHSGHHGAHHGAADPDGAGTGHEMPHRFEDAEAWAKRFDAPDRDSWQQPAALIAMMELQPGMAVADLGAGTGYFLPHLARAVGTTGSVLALDVEPTLIAHMQARAAREGLPMVEARLIPMDGPGLPPASVDRIVTINTWHHLGDRGAYAAKLRAALKPGGALYVVDYTMESEDGPPKDHRIPPAQIIAELEQGGFQAELLAEELPRQLVIRAR